MPFLRPQNRISLAIPSKAIDFLENCIGLFQEIAEMRVYKKNTRYIEKSKRIR